MNNKKWFKPKKYGYGFCPITWEGWLATFVFIGLIFVSAYINNFYSFDNKIIIEPTIKESLRFFLDVIIFSFLFISFFKNKVEGELKWNWGNKIN